MKLVSYLALGLMLARCQPASLPAPVVKTPPPVEPRPLPSSTEAPPIDVIPVSIQSANVREYAEGTVTLAPLGKATSKDTLFHGTIAFLLEADANVQIGSKVRVVFESNPWVVFEASIDSRQLVGERVLAHFAVKGFRGIAEGNALLRGARGIGRILLRERQVPATVPLAAVHFDGNGSYALVLVRDGDRWRVRRQKVEVAGTLDAEQLRTIGSRLVVRAGLAQGDQVVLDAATDLADGALVQAISPLPRRTGNPKDGCNPLRFRLDVATKTVLDRRSLLQWDASDTPQRLTLAAAEARCAERQMRLPTIEELVGLLETDLGELDPCAFTAQGDQYWTATPGEYVESRWTLNRTGTSPSAQSYSGEASVRCVFAGGEGAYTDHSGSLFRREK